MMNVLHLKKLSETFAEWEDKRSHVVVSLARIAGCSDFCQRQAKDHNFDPMEL